MLNEFLPFSIDIDTTALLGTALWATALYIGLSPLSEWVMERLADWMNWAERSLYTSTDAYERARKGWESRNAFYASLLSIVPFLLVGGLCHWGVEVSLGQSWGVSLGIMALIGCSVYELGRRDGRSSR